MASGIRSPPFASMGHPAHASVEQFFNMAELAAPSDDPAQRTRFCGDTQRQLVLRQAPLHARVALGKEKDRKPIDPPPIIQLLDKRNNGRTSIYDSPYIFLTSSLVPENYDEQERGPELPSNYLTGSLASSIHRLKDSPSTEGGFFVFGDLSVKKEGRYRLRFTLYERDDFSKPSSFYYVSELISNVFTVYPPRRFPGMTESSVLTRSFSDQGVKVRLRKEKRGLNPRKRNLSAADSVEAMLNRDTKRTAYDQGPSFAGFLGVNSGHLDPNASQGDLAQSQPFSPSESPLSARASGGTFRFPPAGYYMPNFPTHPYQ